MSKTERCDPAATVMRIETRGGVADPCEALAVALVLAECDEKGAAERIARELGGDEAARACCEAGPGAMAREIGESHVFDFLVGHPELVERAGYKVVTEPAGAVRPSVSRKLAWENMQPRLAAVGLADFPPAQPQDRRFYALAGPEGEWEDYGLMSVDDALARASELFGEACAEVTVWAQEPVRAAVDGDAVLDDVLEDIWQTAGTDAFEYLFDRVTRDELSDLSKRLTACLGAWLADTGNSLDGLWCGVDPRTFRRALDGAWVELDGEVTR